MTDFHEGTNHNHRPSGKWAEVQANPNSPEASWWLIRACKNLSPRNLVLAAINQMFNDKPIALRHLTWYLNHKGLDFQEDANIKAMLEQDKGVQDILRFWINLLDSGRTRRGKVTGQFKLEQLNYANVDFKYAFGAIDKLDLEVDFDAETVHVWFQDRYDWHPVYPGLYTKYPDDVARDTNCVHAALVELKAGWPSSLIDKAGSGAADFWMKGEATVPLKVIGFSM
jgi:hypothetical protein